MRQIVLDTETTGLETSRGHRIIEIGCVELINRRVTDNHWHFYVNPDREVDIGAFEVHGISDDFLQDKPRFEEIESDFIQYIDGAELVIHNAAFDIGFLNYEFSLLNASAKKVDQYCTVLDTLTMARQKHPGQKNNLDALCRRYDIDNSQRSLHGALLDARILADVYLAMTGGQTALVLDDKTSENVDSSGIFLSGTPPRDIPLVLWEVSEDAQKAHLEYIDYLAEQGNEPAWK